MSEDLPQGWSRTLLRELVGPHGLMADGDWVESKDQDPNGDVRLTQLADVGDGKFLDKSNRFLTSDKAKQLNCTMLQPRDILISRLGEPLGKTCLFPKLDQQCVTVVDVHVVRPESADVTREWLMHTLNSAPVRREIESMSSGTTRKRITGKKLKGLEIPIPPAHEQQRIASKIDELFSRIDEGERALARVGKLVERYRQSVLKAAVTGELTRDWCAARKAAGEPLESGQALLERILVARREAWEAAELAKLHAKGKPPATDAWKKKYKPPQPPDTTDLPDLPEGWVWATVDQIGFVTGGLTKNRKRNDYKLQRPYLRVANVYANRLDLSEVHEIGVTEDELERVSLESEDLLVVEGNGSIEQIGRVALWDGSVPGCVHQNHLIKVRCNMGLPSWYVLIWCMSSLGRAHIRKVASSTAGLHTLSISKVQALPVPVPPVNELAPIRDRFEQMNSVVGSQKAAIQEQKSRSSSLRQSILKAAFAGQLVPQDPNDEPASALLERIAAERATAAPAKARRGRKRADSGSALQSD